MKYFITVVLAVFLFSCKENESAAQSTLDAKQFESAIQDSSVQLLDVRTPGEFAQGHIANALLADWKNTAEFERRVSFIDKDRPVAVYCLSGARSSAAAEWMKKNGFTDVRTLQGGIMAWKNAGLAVEGPKDMPQMSAAEYEQKINSNSTVLVDVGAEWCPPCVKMKPIVEEVVKEADSKMAFVPVDAGSQSQIMDKLGISEIPVFIVYKDGKEAWRHTGILTKEELQKALSL